MPHHQRVELNGPVPLLLLRSAVVLIPEEGTAEVGEGGLQRLNLE